MHRKFSLQPVALAILACLSLQASAAPPSPDHPAVSRALAHLQGSAFQAARSSLSDSFQASDLVIDADGTEHVRFDRRYKGLPVIAGDVIVRSGAQGQFQTLIQSMKTGLSLDIRPAITADQAKGLALQKAALRDAKIKHSQLVVYALEGRPKLAWQVRVDGVKADRSPCHLQVIVDAQRGSELARWDTIHTADTAGTGKTLHSGTVALRGNSVGTQYELTDLTRGGQFVVDMNGTEDTETLFTDADNRWGNGRTSNRQTVAADAAYGGAMTWDYFLNVHGRSGIGNDGLGARSRVHFGVDYVNAFWDDDCFCMTYGDGDATYKPLVSLDIAGHEMTHGITSRTANLIYLRESGGLNEATSDIFGTMVEFYANNPKDAPDYLIGEKLSAKPIRSMVNPNSVDRFSVDCWYPGVALNDVHWISGIGNHFFYLLAEGTVNGSPSKTCVEGNKRKATGSGSVNGIGRDKAAKIWYRALTTKMVASETHARARVSTITAAEELYGAGSVEAQAVAAAWAAVNVK